MTHALDHFRDLFNAYTGDLADPPGDSASVNEMVAWFVDSVIRQRRQRAMRLAQRGLLLERNPDYAPNWFALAAESGLDDDVVADDDLDLTAAVLAVLRSDYTEDEFNRLVVPRHRDVDAAMAWLRERVPACAVPVIDP